jgi:uncharacterized protein (DUF488 family)
LETIRQRAADRLQRNAKSLAHFGMSPTETGSSIHLRTVRQGGTATVFTIGYEKRDPEDLITRLRDAGITILADIREKPTSRRADYRGSSLKALCEDAGIQYQGWPALGSTETQRDDLKAGGDIAGFHKTFRAYAEQNLMPEIDRLAAEVLRRSVVLLCYERSHEDCHRMVIADLVAEKLDATVIAIV